MSSNESQRQVLPALARGPLMLMAALVLPQVLLLLLNARSYWLVSGEMSPDQHAAAFRVAIYEIGLLLGGGFFTLFALLRKKTPTWPMLLLILVAHVGYLWMIMPLIGTGLLPAATSAWILPPENVFYHQFALIMPAVFYAALLLASAPLPISRSRDVGLTFLLLLGIPFFWFCVGRLFSWWVGLSEYFVVPAFVLATILCVMALLRLLVFLAVWFPFKGGVAQGILIFLVSLAAPIGGLLLNQSIPFPSDFQDPWVYGMTIINGLLLLVPRLGGQAFNRGLWLLRCALFPFSIYFFVVFLPFLPLSLLAIVAAGAGFLMLAPTGLFLIHLRELIHGWREDWKGSTRLKPFLLGAIAFLLIPGFYTLGALRDRRDLNQAIEFVYEADHRGSTHFTGSLVSVKRGLLQLQRFKQGVQMPFLSDYYNSLVFGGLVLPDAKMNHIHRFFFGKDLEPMKERSMSWFAAGARGSRGRASNERMTAPPPRTVEIKDIQVARRIEGGCERAMVSLHLLNRGSSQAESVTAIQIPEGVFVSGYWLHMGKERVPGRIFERKTAAWVYEMIRDQSRRDPGLLVYLRPELLQLSVFPFAGEEERITEIEFVYPVGMSPTLQVGDRKVELGAANASGPQMVLVQTNEKQGSLVLSAQALSKLPVFMRQPYLHFLVDRSEGCAASLKPSVEAMRKAIAQFPEAQECLVSVGNFEWVDATPELIKMDALAAVDFTRVERALPARGGFCQDRGIKRAALQYQDRSFSQMQWAIRVPIFVIVRGEKSEPVVDDDLESFMNVIPDVKSYSVTTHEGMLEHYGLDRVVKSGHPRPFPVTLFKCGNHFGVCGNNGQIGVASLDGDGVGFYNPKLGTFEELTGIPKLPSNNPYSQGVRAWMMESARLQNQKNASLSLIELVKVSQSTGFLMPSTSYIAVESLAQWKILELKQKQKLENKVALEFQEGNVPEPSTWLLLVIASVVLPVMKFLKTRRVTAQASTSRRRDTACCVSTGID